MGCIKASNTCNSNTINGLTLTHYRLVSTNLPLQLKGCLFEIQFET